MKLKVAETEEISNFRGEMMNDQVLSLMKELKVNCDYATVFVPYSNIKLHVVFWRNRQTRPDTSKPIYSSEMGVQFLSGHFLCTLYSQICSHRPCTTLLRAREGSVWQEIKHHIIKRIGYTLTSDVHFTSVRSITMHILFGTTWSRSFRYYSFSFLLCRKDSTGPFPSETLQKGKGKTFPLPSF